MTQSNGAKNTFFFLVTLHDFQKSGRAIALPAPPSPQVPENEILLLLKTSDVSLALYKVIYTYTTTCQRKMTLKN